MSRDACLLDRGVLLTGEFFLLQCELSDRLTGQVVGVRKPLGRVTIGK